MVSVWRPLPSRGSRTPHLVRVGPSSARSPRGGAVARSLVAARAGPVSAASGSAGTISHSGRPRPHRGRERVAPLPKALGAAPRKTLRRHCSFSALGRGELGEGAAYRRCAATVRASLFLRFSAPFRQSQPQWEGRGTVTAWPAGTVPEMSLLRWLAGQSGLGARWVCVPVFILHHSLGLRPSLKPSARGRAGGQVRLASEKKTPP